MSDFTFSFISFVLPFITTVCMAGVLTQVAQYVPWGVDKPTVGKQKFHRVATSRLAGVAILLGLGVVYWRMPVASQWWFGWLLVASMPAFLGGLAEDLSGKVSPFYRLILTFAAAGLAWWFIDARLYRVGVYLFDDGLAQFAWLSMMFTMFAVGGVAHSINIIDGYNGLMSGVCIMATIAFAVIAADVGDTMLLSWCFMLLSVLLGFFVWNFPWGKIFMGDGGAYLLGFLLAEVAVLLVFRHDHISPWSGFMVMGYPIVETLFSMYRKKVVRKMSPGQPDGLHLHMLIYKRLVCRRIRANDQSSEQHAHRLKYAHAITSVILFLFASIPMIIGVFTYDSSPKLLLGLLLFTLLYLGVYHQLLPSFARISSKYK